MLRDRSLCEEVQLVLDWCPGYGAIKGTDEGRIANIMSFRARQRIRPVNTLINASCDVSRILTTL